MAKGAPVPGGGWWSWWQSVILGSTCSQFKLMGHQSSLIIYCQLFCNIHDPMCFLIHYETLDRMWVVRTALLQWRHHHWPLLVEVLENLRKWKNGENTISIIITIIESFVLLFQVIYGRSWQEVATDPRFRVNNIQDLTYQLVLLFYFHFEKKPVHCIIQQCQSSNINLFIFRTTLQRSWVGDDRQRRCVLMLVLQTE